MSYRNLQNERTYDIMLTKYESAAPPQVFSCRGPTGASTSESRTRTAGIVGKSGKFTVRRPQMRNDRRAYREAESTVLQEGNRRKNERDENRRPTTGGTTYEIRIDGSAEKGLFSCAFLFLSHKKTATETKPGKTEKI